MTTIGEFIDKSSSILSEIMGGGHSNSPIELIGAGFKASGDLRPTAPGFALDLTADRPVLMVDTARCCPSECLLAPEDLSGALPPMRGAETVANTVAMFGAEDIDVSADRPAFDFGGCRTEPGGRIEQRLSGLGWPSADALPQGMGDGGR